MNLPQWYAELAVRQPDLFRLIGSFHTRPQHWAHPERLAGIPHAEVREALAASPAAQPHVSRWLSAQLGIAHLDPWWDFTPARRRLVLMRWTTLDQLACYCGAAIHAAKIAATIARAQTAELKSVIGAAAHVFALRRGRLIAAPEVPGLDFSTGAPGTLGHHVYQSGWAALLAMLSCEPPEILERFQIKLPPSLPVDKSARLAPEDCERLWKFVRKVGGEVFTKEEIACFA